MITIDTTSIFTIKVTFKGSLDDATRIFKTELKGESFGIGDFETTGNTHSAYFNFIVGSGLPTKQLRHKLLQGLSDALNQYGYNFQVIHEKVK